MERKLDISAISFDDMIGDGLESIEETEVNEPSNIEEASNEKEEDERIVDDILEDADEEIEYEPELDEEDLPQAESDSELDIVSQIANTLGFEVEGGYEETVEGLTNFVRDMSQQAAEEQLKGLFEQFPEVQKHLDFVMAGGDSSKFLQTYSPQTDFGAIEFAEEDTQVQRAVLGQYLQARGHDNEFIKDTLDTFQDNGKLFGKAQQAKSELAKYQENQRVQLLEQQKQQFEAQKKQEEEFWNGLANTIETKSDFAGISIPDRQKGKFFEYISQPVGPNGETQRDLDYQQSEMDVKIAMDYLMYSGFKIDDIINKKAKTKSAQSLRERIISNEERVKSARKATRSKKFDVDNLDMNALLG
jgi:hypothetical protein